MNVPMECLFSQYESVPRGTSPRPGDNRLPQSRVETEMQLAIVCSESQCRLVMNGSMAMPKEDDVWNSIVSIGDFIWALPHRACRATQAFVQNWWYARYH